MDLTLPVDPIVLAAVLCCALVAGLLFAFAVVVMPGLGGLGDSEYLRAFRAVDGVIQRGQPLFITVWAGSAILPLVAVVVRLLSDSGPMLGLLVAAAALSLIGVHAPTVAVNVPLNNRLQAVDVGALDAAGTERERRAFEPRWRRWNAVRTVAAAVVVLLLALALTG
ncbi:DUF1772 domain-containing protein [Geodermatophilus sp. YIM 151500]|uniref:anthrone oxygenase family protein n=1 Tax=Geodermatophilus sp. YIM 151500 TaxID=2984531 RepID=UPI0021E475D7|nr:anthrone oxygenase family protein [Geodermatophilus sp. YIM 151500]MCV2488226.1 DUF1772 domain-containing protein [Geodermatophilus sp. YIM 151500]